LLTENDQSTKKLCDRFSKGVEKLDDASSQVKELNEKLVIQREAVEEKTKACETLLSNILESQNIATESHAQSSQKAKEMETQSKEIENEKKEAEIALSKALPALEQARAALSELDKNDVTEIRSFVKPPQPVQVISECICVFKGMSDVSWKAAKGMMADTNFLQSLQAMDMNSIGSKQLSTVKEHLISSKITMEQMRIVSKAGAGFLRFVHAVLEYCEVLQDVRPKREKVAKLEKLFSQNERDLDRIKRKLARVEEDVRRYNEKLATAKEEQAALQEETKIMERRLEAADKLFNGLGLESVRWREEIETLKKKRQNLLGDCLVSAAFLTYSGPFFYNLRQRMLHDDWLPDISRRGIPISEDFKFNHLLTDEVTVANWNACGLPGDELSVQNGILTTRASRFPLFIDPQQQALKWLKTMEEKNKLRVATFNDPDFLKYLELAIKYGTPFLLEDVYDHIDPIIQNVLSKNILVEKNRSYVMLGDKKVEYDPNFRLYLNTKLSNPAYGPKVFGNATVINCTITEEALQNQLLDVIVKHEQSGLEEKKNMLIHTISDNRKILKKLESNLLLNFTLSTGNILDNEELINTMEETKHKVTDTAEKLVLAAKTSAEIEALTCAYRPAAKRGALLFFILTDMATISPMYQFALAAYTKLFETVLQRSAPDTVLKRRLTNIITKITEAGNVAVECETQKCPVSWLTNSNWRDLQRLEEILPIQFKGLTKSWYSLSNLEDEPPPYFEMVTSFQKLCLLRCFRLDRICRAVENFVAEILGNNCMSSSESSLATVYEQSHPETPIVFILSPGSDPTESLKKFAKSHLDLDPSINLKFLSMGQGQETSALKLFKLASADGSWLILQNCHLLVKWIPQLKKSIESTKKFHPNFRLWITTEPSPDFPIDFLQLSLKVVTEPLLGLKRNLRATFLEIPASKFVECQHPAFSTLAYTLSFFHAVVQERRQYGKLGWNVPYDFNLSDFHASLAVIVDQMKSTRLESEISWGSLRYLIDEVMYGGRVIDEFDRRVLRTYIHEYFGEFLFDKCQYFHFYANKRIVYGIPSDVSREGIISK
uniref:Dynein, axonemal, heavy chain 5 n=1 Tax=Rodentolepis nana TaxID=102285 RepID=A0A0R3TKG0_RODNA